MLTQEHYDVSADVLVELERARSMNPPSFNSLHEGYAVLLEEVDELWEEVKKKGTSRSHHSIYAEAVQIAAIAVQIATDFGLNKDQPL